MNTIVNFEIAKLLKEKGFESESKAFYDGSGELFYYNYSNNVMQRFRYAAPTIAEVVMWLYEKHGIWVSVTFKRHSQNKHFSYNIRQANGIETYLWEHNSPTEAYEAAIEYTLNNLI